MVQTLTSHRPARLVVCWENDYSTMWLAHILHAYQPPTSFGWWQMVPLLFRVEPV
jgi:hypothetical protein